MPSYRGRRQRTLRAEETEEARNQKLEADRQNTTVQDNRRQNIP